MAITVTGGPAYGLAWNKTTDAYTRVASAAGLTAGANFNSPSGGAWGLRRCNLWDDGTPTAYYGDRCYTDTDVDNMGQAMVQIPKFYYYMEYDAGTTTYYWFVTTVAATTIDVGLGVGAKTVKIHPAFTRDGATRNNIYLGAYEAYGNPVTTLVESKAGVQPTVSATLAAFRVCARLRAGAIANKWEVQDYLSTTAVELLYLIEYGGFNSQALLSAGITNMHDDANHNQASNTGHTTTLGNASGQVLHTFDHVPDSGDTTGYAMSYRGIENFYGNIFTRIDGIKLKPDYKPWVADHDFNDSITYEHPYIDTTLTLSSTSDYAVDISISANHDYGFLASAVGGSSTTKLCDMYVRYTGDRTAQFGGAWPYGAEAGAFYWYVASAAADGGVMSGGRLMYIG
jgi:hypothetical protein